MLPPSLREQSVLVVKQQSTQQRDELDELLHIEERRGTGSGGRGVEDRIATLASGKAQKGKGDELRSLESELDDLLNL